MSYLPSDPELSSIEELLAKYPRRGILLFKLLEDSRGNCSPLSKEFRELIIAYVSTLHQPDSSTLILKVFSDGLENNGADHVGPIAQDKTPRAIGKIAPIMRFLKKLTLTPGQISNIDVDPIFDAGWDERAFLDIVCLCAVVNCISRLTVGIGIDRPSGFRQRIITSLSSQVFPTSMDVQGIGCR